eukprot:1000955-Prymnesium_polylepis.1
MATRATRSRWIDCTCSPALSCRLENMPILISVENAQKRCVCGRVNVRGSVRKVALTCALPPALQAELTNTNHDACGAIAPTHPLPSTQAAAISPRSNGSL